MKFDARVKALIDGGWQARYIGGKVETLTCRGATKDEALEKLKAEIRYHLEYCP